MGFCLTLTSVFQSIAGLVRSNQLLRFGFDTISKSNSPVGSKFGLSIKLSPILTSARQNNEDKEELKGRRI